ncbi:MAG: hypothetical protein EZS28_053934, partial [Streblomastix strix]
LPQHSQIYGRLLYGNNGSTDSFNIIQIGVCEIDQDPKECPCPTDADLLKIDPRKDLQCKAYWNKRDEVFIGDKNLIIEEETFDWEVRSSSDSLYGRSKQTPLETLEAALKQGIIKQKEMKIVVVTTLSNINIEIPTERLTQENCDIVSISRDYIQCKRYPIKQTSGRLFSNPGVSKPMFKVNKQTLILSSLDLVSIGSQQGTVTLGESLIVGTEGSKISIYDVMLTMGERIESLFHIYPVPPYSE